MALDQRGDKPEEVERYACAMGCLVVICGFGRFYGMG
jgi:hypothetical protein